MAYCRWLEGDVYMIHHVYGFIECCMCHLPSPNKFSIRWDVWNPYDYFHDLMRVRKKSYLQPRQKRAYYVKSKREYAREQKPSKKEQAENLRSWRDRDKLVRPIAVFQPRYVNLYRRSEAIRHLEKHQRHGDEFPERAIDRLKKEIETMGDMVRS